VVVTRPDPTAQVRLAIEALRELMFTKMDGYDKIYWEKFRSFEKLHTELADRVSIVSNTIDTKLNTQINNLDDKINDLKNRIIVMEGKSALTDPSTSAIIREMSATIAQLKSDRDQSAGRRDQNVTATQIMIGGLAALAALALVGVDAWAAFMRGH
jgi:hypothetical protein